MRSRPAGRAGATGKPGVTDGADLLTGITDRIEQVLASVTQLGAAAVSAGQAAGAAGRALRRTDLAALRPLVADVLSEHAGLAAGAGVVMAPGAVADVPRCLEWWWADQGSGLEQLEVDLDPESAEFYDYTMTEWYRSPERTGRPSVAGPYVDYICTHEYTFTLSVPCVYGGRFGGVAGADILASQVERLALPGLTQLDRIAVLASASGRVIASNTAGVLPGMAVARQEICADLVPVAGPTSPVAAGRGSLGAGPGVLGGGTPTPVVPWTLLSERQSVA